MPFTLFSCTLFVSSHFLFPFSPFRFSRFLFSLTSFRFSRIDHLLSWDPSNVDVDIQKWILDSCWINIQNFDQNGSQRIHYEGWSPGFNALSFEPVVIDKKIDFPKFKNIRQSFDMDRGLRSCGYIVKLEHAKLRTDSMCLIRTTDLALLRISVFFF